MISSTNALNKIELKHSNDISNNELGFLEWGGNIIVTLKYNFLYET